MLAALLLLFGCFFNQSFQISIPLTRNMNRCMIVYTSSPDENLILDMKFPTLIGTDPSDYFRVTIHNTEDQTEIQQQIKSGIFRKELDLIDSVVYKVCFTFISQRDVKNIIIQYNAQTNFSQQIQTVKVPQTLLKSEDFKSTYSYADNMHSLTSTTLQFQKQRRMKEDAIYEQNKKYINLLFWISIFQITVICITGMYQFYSLRSFLLSKQYL